MVTSCVAADNIKYWKNVSFLKCLNIYHIHHMTQQFLHMNNENMCPHRNLYLDVHKIATLLPQEVKNSTTHHCVNRRANYNTSTQGNIAFHVLCC